MTNSNIKNTGDQPIIIFTDAATSPQKHIAIGGFLCLTESTIKELAGSTLEFLSGQLANQISYTQFNSKKSTWSEIKTVITALEFVEKNFPNTSKIEIYTDCQSLCDLLGRRKEKLQKTNFITRSGKTLQNADLYKELFVLAEKFPLHPFKIKGHAPMASRLSIQEKIFSMIDKFTRQKLRAVLNLHNSPTNN